MSKNTYAAAVVWQTDENEFDATEELIDALNSTRQPIDHRFVGGAVLVPETEDEYDSETVGPYIAGTKTLGEPDPVPPRSANELRFVKALGDIAEGVPRDDEWRSAASFIENVAAILDAAGIHRPSHYRDEDSWR